MSLIFLTALAPAAMAQSLTAPNSPSAQSEDSGATNGLGSSHRFANPAVAKSHCGSDDPVVWSDGYHLTYSQPGTENYGKRTGNYGFYACQSEADSAGFHPVAN